MSEKVELAAEIEAKFIEIDKEALREKLKQLDAKLLQKEMLMRKTVFYTDDHSFARVRDEGRWITMSYKRLDELSLTGMKEVCLKVDSYESAVQMLQALGLRIKSEQETLRESWFLDGVELDMDTWPWLPSVVEIEGSSEVAVKTVAQKLGFDFNDAIFGGIDEVYKLYFDVTSDEVNQKWSEIKFCDGKVPQWLEAKRLR